MGHPEAPSAVYPHTRIYWDDLRFPAHGISIFGIGDDPDWDSTNGLLLFAGAVTDERVFVVAQLPHGWKEGTVLKPHVHFYKTTSAAGTVHWKCEYKWAPIGEVVDAEFTELTATGTEVVANGDTASKHAINALGDIDASGRQISDHLIFKLTRMQSTDTYGSDVALLEFDIHYQVDTPGSRQEYTK